MQQNFACIHQNNNNNNNNNILQCTLRSDIIPFGAQRELLEKYRNRFYEQQQHDKNIESFVVAVVVQNILSYTKTTITTRIILENIIEVIDVFVASTGADTTTIVNVVDQCTVNFTLKTPCSAEYCMPCGTSWYRRSFVYDMDIALAAVERRCTSLIHSMQSRMHNHAVLMLHSASERGFLDIAQWLTQEFSLFRLCGPVASQEDVHKILCTACKHGHTHIVSWLLMATPHHHPDDDDDTIIIKAPFRKACKCGHITLAKYLISRCSITRCKDFALILGAFRSSVVHMQVEVAQWLSSLFKLSFHEHCLCIPDFSWSCVKQNTDFCSWMECKLTLELLQMHMEERNTDMTTTLTFRDIVYNLFLLRSALSCHLGSDDMCVFQALAHLMTYDQLVEWTTTMGYGILGFECAASPFFNKDFCVAFIGLVGRLKSGHYPPIYRGLVPALSVVSLVYCVPDNDTMFIETFFACNVMEDDTDNDTETDVATIF